MRGTRRCVGAMRRIRRAAGILLAGALLSPGGAAAEPRSVFFVMIDTLRADHLGCYGYERDTSPTLDRLAARGILFERFTSVAPWTNPAIVTLFTGLHPRAVMPPEPHRDAIARPLPAALDTLAERLREAGLATVALVDHPGLSPRLAFDQGFDVFVRLYARAGAEPGGSPEDWTTTPKETVVEAVDRALTAVGERPFFLYLHLVYPHQPYRAPEPWRDHFGPVVPPDWVFWDEGFRAELVNAYDGEIRFTDAVLEEALDVLDRRGRADDAWIVVTSDHGEAFWEHGLVEHGHSLYDELLRVPLVLVPPGGLPAPRRIPQPASSVDLLPTVLDLAGAPPPEDVDGASLLRFARGEAEDAGWIFAANPHRRDVEATAVLRGDWKLVRNTDPELPPEELYDRERDADESRNLLREEPGAWSRLWRGLRLYWDGADSVEAMRSALAAHEERTRARREALAPRTVELDPDTHRRLEALGYTD